MRIIQLNFFVVIAETKSIHKASERLHISHQSLHTSLKSLENELNCTLFDRSPAGVRLTAAGKILYDYALEVLDRTTALQKQLAPHTVKTTETKKTQGKLDCFLSSHIAINILPEIVQTFSARYPSVILNLREQDSKKILSQIIAGEHHFALITAYDTPQLPDHVLYETLFFEKDLAAVSVKHPLAQFKSVSIKHLMQYPLAIYQLNHDYDNISLELLSQFGKPNIQMLSNNLKACEAIISAGQAVGLAPRRAIKKKLIFENVDNVVYLNINKYPAIQIGYVVSNDYYAANKPIIDQFIALFKDLW